MKRTLTFFLPILILACFVQDFSIAVSSAEPKVFADRLRSAKNYAVEYILPTKEGQDIAFVVDYRGGGDSPMDYAVLQFPNKERPFIGEKTYHFKATNRKEIAVTFRFSEDGKRDMVRLDPPRNKKKDKEVFFVKSRGGYLIRIAVSWEGEKISSIRMEPKKHPFAKW